jgi:hypothetical protein
MDFSSMSKTQDKRSPASPCYAIVSMLGKRRKCKVTAYGKQKEEYDQPNILWVERGEDEYGIPPWNPPFCVLYREDWLRGVDA